MTIQPGAMRGWGALGGISARYSATLDAADEGVAWMGQVPLTGTMTHIVFGTVSHTSNATMVGRIEGVSSSEKPSGSLYVANANGTILVNAANSVFSCPLNSGTGVVVTRGDKIATIIRQPNSSPGNTQIHYGLGDSYQINPGNYRTYFDSSGSIGTWGSDDTFRTQTFGFLYAGGIYVRGGPFVVAPTSGGISYDGFVSTTSPGDERGNRFIPTFSARCVGVEGVVIRDSPGTWRARLRSASGTLLASSPVYSSASSITVAMFDTAADLVAGTAYLVTIEATNSSGNITLQGIDYASNAVMVLNAGFADMHKCSLTDGGSVVLTNTQLLSLFPVFDGFDDGAGGGGGGTTIRSRAGARFSA